MSAEDPRVRLACEGWAAADLEGRSRATQYRRPERLSCRRGRTSVRRGPAPDAEQVSELLFGEAFLGLLERDDQVFGQCGRDGYVGWASRAALAPDPGLPTHRVRALATFAFEEPSIKAAVRERLPMNALLIGAGERGSFLELSSGGFAPRVHLDPLGRFESRPEEVAKRFLGTPYLWGGRTADGLDCSGLVQAARFACGLGAPRDSDQQMALGRPLEVAEDLAGLAPGDLVFWRGHVGIMISASVLIHANASAMTVALEDLAAAVVRIQDAGGGPPTGFRRP